MKWVLRIVGAVLVIVLVAVLAGAGWMWSRVQASKPALDGEIALEGLTGEAVVARDENGVPHIFAGSDADVFFALGYVHADERFFQMDLARRYVHGRLSELFGPIAVRSDARVRTRGFPQATEAVIANAGPETRAAVEAYVAGVNARLGEGRPAPEYLLLGARPEAWTMLDTAAITIYLADDLAAGQYEEYARADLGDTLSPERLEDWLAPFPDWAPTTLKDADLTARFEGGEGANEGRTNPEPAPGSNAWVVSGERSVTGRPLLANDPHLGLNAPSIWYFTRLELEDGPVVGGTVPGAPFVTLGRNAHGAWGFTNTGFDVMDLVARPEGDAQVVAERVETIEVADAEPVEITVRETAEGPILDPDWFNLEGFGDADVVLRSTVTSPENGVADAIFAIMKSRNWDEFVEAGRTWTAPMQNMHYAGVDGTIGYTTAGLLPIRGEDGSWTGFVPFEELPRVSNPQGGYIASGNNLVAGEAYPYPLPGDYSVYRAPRIEAMIESQPQHNLDSFAAMQRDVVSVHARRLLPGLLEAEAQTDLAALALERLEGWDGAMLRDRPEPLIFSLWMEHFTEAAFADELGEAFEANFFSHRLLLDQVISGETPAWCDDVETGAEETCPQMLGAALDSAMEAGAADHGGDLSRWRWGDAARAVFDHPFSGQSLVGERFDIVTAIDGDGSTVNVAHFPYGEGTYDVYHAASMRAIYDLSDLDASLYMHAPGQSGHPFSPHYRDLAGPWADGQFFTIPADFGPEALPEEMRVLRLTPQ